MSVTAVVTTRLPEVTAMNALILSQVAAAGSQDDMCKAFMAMIKKIERRVTDQTEVVKSLESRNAALEGKIQQDELAATTREKALQDQIGALSGRVTAGETRITAGETRIASLESSLAQTNKTLNALQIQYANHRHRYGAGALTSYQV